MFRCTNCNTPYIAMPTAARCTRCCFAAVKPSKDRALKLAVGSESAIDISADPSADLESVRAKRAQSKHGLYLRPVEAYKAVPLNQIKAASVHRMKTGFKEFDKFIGGGLVRGTVVVCGGDPGAGKTTFPLQIASRLYGLTHIVSAEEQPDLLAGTARRVGANLDKIHIGWTRDIDAMLQAPVEKDLYDLVVINSLQKYVHPEDAAGLITDLSDYAVKHKLAVFVISRLAKDGSVAGKKDIEYDGDVTMFIRTEPRFDKDPRRVFDIDKNRFGEAQNSIEAWMTADGLSFRKPDSVEKLENEILDAMDEDEEE